MIHKLLAQIRKHEKALLLISLVYIVGVSIYMIVHRSWFSPDQFFFFALLGAFIIGRARIFFFDWLPFLFFYLGYEFLRGLVPYISHNVHIFPMINMDKFLLGFIPTIEFQKLWYHPTHLHWYDYFLVICYIAYFIVPMVVGYWFWIKDRKFFRKYAITYLVLTYACFITFIIFPAMPPWMASSQGYLPPIKEVTGVVVSHFLPADVNFPTVYSLVASDPVAAVPSLHAAVPALVFLFLLKWHKKWALTFLPYLLGVWFAVMYLGEHYLTDVIIGAIYAIGAFLLVENWRTILNTLRKMRAYVPSLD